MTIDFTSLVKDPAARDAMRRRLVAERAEMSRLHSLADRWLAEAVLGLARKVRETHPNYGFNDVNGSYNGALVWEVIPELARRVGCRLRPGESTLQDLRMASGQDLRDYVGVVLANISWSAFRNGEPSDFEADLSPFRLVCHEVANGSPVAMLLDRIVPPTEASEDKCATTIRKISATRGYAPVSTWSPELQGKPRPFEVAEGDDLLPTPRM